MEISHLRGELQLYDLSFSETLSVLLTNVSETLFFDFNFWHYIILKIVTDSEINTSFDHKACMLVDTCIYLTELVGN